MLSRRTVLKALGAPALVGVAGCSDPDPAPPDRSMVAPRRWDLASTFTGAVGVNVHLRFLDTVYQHTESVVSLVTGLGVGLVRDRLSVGSPEQQQGFQALADSGVRAHLTCGVFGETTPETYADLLDELRTAYAPTRPLRETFASFGGPNEPNDDPRPDDWAALAREQQRQLWDTFRSEPGLDDVAIVGPALKINVPDLPGDFAALGDLSPWCDYGDFHHYTAGRPPSAGLLAMTRLARDAFPTRPLYCTEGGYNDGISVVGAGQALPEEVTAVYAPRQVLEHYLRRQVFFVYELLDDPDPQSLEWQAHYGLVATPGSDPSTWRPKPAYLALQRLLALVNDPASTGRVPPSVVDSIEGGSDQRQITLRRRDGSQVVLLWRDVEVYDVATGQSLEVAPATASVRLERPARVEVFDLVDDQPITVLEATTTFDVALDGRARVCRVTPA